MRILDGKRLLPERKVEWNVRASGITGAAEPVRLFRPPLDSAAGRFGRFAPHSVNAGRGGGPAV